jgi:hypothetical protein
MINNDLFRLKIKLSDSSTMTKEEFEEVEKSSWKVSSRKR